MTNKIDPATLSIKNEKYTSGRSVKSKYDDIFSQLQQGQRLACPPDYAPRLSSLLKKWLEKKGYRGIVVKSRMHCDDKQGGVWWLEGEIPAATKWNTPNGRAPLKRAA